MRSAILAAFAAWAVLATIALAVAPAPSPAAADSPRQLVQKLLDPAKRNAALDKLIQLNHYKGGPTDTALVNHVVVCPQPQGEPLYAVFKDEHYAVWSGAGPGKPQGHVLLFDSDGKYVPFYLNANAPRGVFADVNGDGIVENVEAIKYGLRHAATVIYVIPIVEKPAPLLCMAYNPWNRKTEKWAWQVADARKDGVLQIQLGPVVSILGDPAHSREDNGTNKQINPVVTYTWDKDKKAYVGPAGGDDQPFKRIDPEKPLEEQIAPFDATPAPKPATPAGAPVAFGIHNAYFVSKKFEPNEAASFVVIHDQKAFDAAFGVPMMEGAGSQPLPKNALETRMVVAVVKRGKAFWGYMVQAVAVEAGVLTLQYTTTFTRSDSAESASPLIVSVAKGAYTAVEFVEDGKVVKKMGLAAPPAPPNPPARKGPPMDLAGIKTMRDLEYAKVGDNRLLLDLYVPENADGPLPLIVWIHGGAWTGGDKAGGPAMGQLKRGYAVASINYRLSQVAIFPAQIHDCKAAIRWLRAHAKEYNINPQRIGVWGSSAGGHLVALLGTSGNVKELEGDEGNLDQSSRVQAVCDWFGPTDFCQMAAHMLPGAKMEHDTANSPESRLVGGPIQENKEKVAKANPITYVSKDDPPFLIMHGDKDPLVPHHQSEILAEALKKAGVDVTFKTVEGAGHGFGGPEVMKMVEEFFDKHLKAPAK